MVRRPGTDRRGNKEDKARRKQWLLDTFGDGTTCPCTLRISRKCLGTLTKETLTVDRIMPGHSGGRYNRDNIQPACGPCNTKKGNIPPARLTYSLWEVVEGNHPVAEEGK